MKNTSKNSYFSLLVSFVGAALLAGTPAYAQDKTAEDKFQIEGAVVFTFDAAKNQMTVKRRGGGERVFTKEK